MIGVVIRRPAIQRPPRVVAPETPVEAPRRRGWVGLRSDIAGEMRRYGVDPRPTAAEMDWRSQ